VVGFTKAYNMEQSARERQGASLVKAVDFEPSRKTVEPADQLIAETLFDPGVVEVGYFNDQRLHRDAGRDGRPRMAAGHGAGQGHGLRRHRRGRRHHQRHHHDLAAATAAARSTCSTWCPRRRETTSTSPSSARAKTRSSST
jgi:hypothetical protein